VVQLYLGFPSEAAEPPQLLRGFQKVTAEAGGQAVASFTLDARALSIWNASGGGWRLVEGEFDVRAGSSSQDVLGQSSLRGTVQSKRAK
jgi:beta-glucosidase